MTHMEVGLLMVVVFAGLGWLTYPRVSRYLAEHAKPKAPDQRKPEE